MKRRNRWCILLSLLMVLQGLVGYNPAIVEAKDSYHGLKSDNLVDSSFYKTDKESYEKNGLNQFITLEKTDKDKSCYFKMFPVKKNIDKYNKEQKEESKKIAFIRYDYSWIRVEELRNGEWVHVINPLDYIDVKIGGNGKYQDLKEMEYYEEASIYGYLRSFFTWPWRLQKTYEEPYTLKFTAKGNQKHSIRVWCCGHYELHTVGGENQNTREIMSKTVYFVAKDDYKFNPKNVTVKAGKESMTISVKNHRENFTMQVEVFRDKQMKKCVVNEIIGMSTVKLSISPGKYYVRVKPVVWYAEEMSQKFDAVVKTVVVK